MTYPLVAACRIFSYNIQTLSCSTWDLFPWPGIEPVPPTLGVQSLSHWTTREVPRMNTLIYYFITYSFMEPPWHLSSHPCPHLTTHSFIHSCIHWCIIDWLIHSFITFVFIHHSLIQTNIFWASGLVKVWGICLLGTEGTEWPEGRRWTPTLEDIL